MSFRRPRYDEEYAADGRSVRPRYDDEFTRYASAAPPYPQMVADGRYAAPPPQQLQQQAHGYQYPPSYAPRGDEEHDRRGWDAGRDRDRDRRDRDLSRGPPPGYEREGSSGDRVRDRSGFGDRERGRYDDHRRREYEREDRGRSYSGRERERSPPRPRRPRRRLEYSGWDATEPREPVYVPMVLGWGAETRSARSISSLLAKRAAGLPVGGPELGADVLPAEGAASPMNDPERLQRRLYVGNLGGESDAQYVADMIRQEMFARGLADRSPELPPLLDVPYHSVERGFLFVEFRSTEDCTSALKLNGMRLGPNSAARLLLKRPHGYVAPPGEAASESDADFFVAPDGRKISSTVPDGPNKLFIGGISATVSDTDLLSLLETVGKVRCLATMRANGSSRGYGFCLYENAALADEAILKLDSHPLGDLTIRVQRSTGVSRGGSTAASESDVRSGDADGGGSPVDQLLNLSNRSVWPTVVAAMGSLADDSHTLQVFNMVSPSELQDDAQYREVEEAVQGEVSRYAGFQGLRIPRLPAEEGFGRVFLQFDAREHAEEAQRRLAGRRFSRRVLVVSFA